MALKYNNNQVNRVLWNGAKTTVSNVNKSYNGGATSSSLAINGKYAWSTTIVTDISTDDISKLTATISVMNVTATDSSVTLDINSDGYVIASCQGQVGSAGKVLATVTITGSYTTYTGKVKKVMFDGRLAWLAPGVTLTDLTGSTWKFKIQVKKTTMSNFSIKFKSNYGEFYGMHLAYSSESNYATSLKYDRGDGTVLHVYPGASSIHWSNGEAYRTFTITGGSDVTNPTLINWLYSTADLVL